MLRAAPESNWGIHLAGAGELWPALTGPSRRCSGPVQRSCYISSKVGLALLSSLSSIHSASPQTHMCHMQLS